MTEYTRTFYKLTVGPGESYEGEVDIGPDFFSLDNNASRDSMSEVATKAGAVLDIQGTKIYPITDGSGEEATGEAKEGKLEYGAFKYSLPHKIEVKILRLIKR